MTTLPHISGTRLLIDRLEKKAQVYRRALQRLEVPDKPYEQIVITTPEVNTLENLILQLSREIAGISEPQEEIWERSHPYCSRNEQASSEPGDIEYFRWFLIWLQQCRAYLDFLEGYISTTGGPRKADEQTVGAIPAVVQPYDVALSFAGPDRKHAKPRGHSFFVASNEALRKRVGITKGISLLRPQCACRLARRRTRIELR